MILAADCLIRVTQIESGVLLVTPCWIVRSGLLSTLSHPDPTRLGPHFLTGHYKFITCFFMISKKNKYISYNLLITLDAGTRLVIITSRGQIAGQMVISIKVVVQVVILNSAI